MKYILIASVGFVLGLLFLVPFFNKGQYLPRLVPTGTEVTIIPRGTDLPLLPASEESFSQEPEVEYRNEEFGFGFRYPKTLAPVGYYDPSEGAPFISIGDVRIILPVSEDISYNSEAKSLEDYKNDHPAGRNHLVMIEASESLEINGQLAVRQKYSSGSRDSDGTFNSSGEYEDVGWLRYVFFDRGEERFIIIKSELQNGWQLDQIARTFRFLP